MTRKRAIEIIGIAVDYFNTIKYREEYKRLYPAFLVLTADPRSVPPTVEEVGDGYGEEDEAWAYDAQMKWWVRRRGEIIRMSWNKVYVAWLPSSAIPIPKGGS